MGVEYQPPRQHVSETRRVPVRQNDYYMAQATPNQKANNKTKQNKKKNNEKHILRALTKIQSTIYLVCFIKQLQYMTRGK